MINRTHHDIFEKLIQDIARLIAELVGANTSDPLLALEQAKQHYLQLEEKELDDIPPEELLNYLLDKPFSLAQLELTGHFLFAEAKLGEDRQANGALKKLQQAQRIIQYVEAHSEVFSDQRRTTLKEIDTLLKSIE